MTVEEFYNSIGGDYQAVMAMLMSEDRIKKYLGKFLADGEYKALEDTMAGKEYKEAFRHSHSLKGMCLNLGLGKLSVSSCALCEALRKDEVVDDVDAMLETVRKDYAEVVTAIEQVI